MRTPSACNLSSPSVITFALLMAASVRPVAQQPEPAPVRVGSTIRPPQKIKDVKPVYPADAQRSGIQGVVVIEATIDANGKVRTATVLRSIPALDAAALDAVRQWEYAPTIVNGQAVPIVFTTTVNFSMAGPPAPARGLVAGFAPSAAALQRAAAIFREARETIDVIQPAQETLGVIDDPRSAAQAIQLIELAKSEALTLSDAAADDAAHAFSLSRAIRGRRSDTEGPAAQDPARRRDAIGWMLKAQVQPDAIRVVVHAHQIERALQLARDSDLVRADVFDPILRVVPEDQILALADECRASDGSYPYAAIGDRAWRSPNASTRSALLERAYALVPTESEFRQRSEGLALVARTYELTPPELAFRTLEALAQRMIAVPSPSPGTRVMDRDLWGAEILAVMSAIDPQRAATVAAEHPGWDAARRVPGKTSLNPVGGPGGAPRNAAPAPQPPPLPSARPLAAMTSPEFDQALGEARAMGPAERAPRLIALGHLLTRASLR